MAAYQAMVIMSEGGIEAEARPPSPKTPNTLPSFEDWRNHMHGQQEESIRFKSWYHFKGIS